MTWKDGWIPPRIKEMHEVAEYWVIAPYRKAKKKADELQAAADLAGLNIKYIVTLDKQNKIRTKDKRGNTMTMTSSDIFLPGGVFEQVLEDMANDGLCFTSHDVTVMVRSRTEERVDHADVREAVVESARDGSLSTLAGAPVQEVNHQVTPGRWAKLYVPQGADRWEFDSNHYRTVAAAAKGSSVTSDSLAGPSAPAHSWAPAIPGVNAPAAPVIPDWADTTPVVPPVLTVKPADVALCLECDTLLPTNKKGCKMVKGRAGFICSSSMCLEAATVNGDLDAPA